jgi:hypothetical protein
LLGATPGTDGPTLAVAAAIERALGY